MHRDRKEEARIIERIKEGEKDLFRVLVDRYGGMVFSILYKVTGNREDAEDLAQETFVKAYFALRKFRGDSSFSTWLYSIAWNSAASSMRKSGWTARKERITDREMKVGEAWFDEGGDLEMKQLREKQYAALEKAVEQLPPHSRFIVSAFYEEGRSLDEIAGITGMSLSNVKVSLFRCRNRLAEIVKETDNMIK